MKGERKMKMSIRSRFFLVLGIVAVLLALAFVGIFIKWNWSSDEQTAEAELAEGKVDCQKMAEETGVPMKYAQVNLIAQLAQYWCVEPSGKMHQLHRGYLQDYWSQNFKERRAVEEACARAGYGKPVDGNAAVVTCEDGQGVGFVWNPLGFKPNPWKSTNN